MKPESMTSLERVLTTLGFKEPDRVPYFLLLTMHGAKELGLSIKEYFAHSKNVVEGQLRMRKKIPARLLLSFLLRRHRGGSLGWRSDLHGRRSAQRRRSNPQKV